MELARVGFVASLLGLTEAGFAGKADAYRAALEAAAGEGAGGPAL